MAMLRCLVFFWTSWKLLSVHHKLLPIWVFFWNLWKQRYICSLWENHTELIFPETLLSPMTQFGQTPLPSLVKTQVWLWTAWLQHHRHIGDSELIVPLHLSWIFSFHCVGKGKNWMFWVESTWLQNSCSSAKKMLLKRLGKWLRAAGGAKWHVSS